jgi:hypothetical protein
MIAGATALAFHGPVLAQPRAVPKQAQALIQRAEANARADCREQGGALSVGDGLLTQGDLNGDSQPDYLIDSAAYRCQGAASIFCGTLGCDIRAVVSGPAGYREIGFAITQGLAIIPASGGDIVSVEVRPSDCGPRADRCTRYWRLLGSEFQVFPTLAAARGAAGAGGAGGANLQAPTAPAGRPLRGAPGPGFRAMQLPGGMLVAALNGTGAMRTLSLGCRAGQPTMLLATRSPARPAEVVISTPSRSVRVSPSRATRPDLWEFAATDPALLEVLTGAEPGFSVTIGGTEAGTYSLSGAAAVRAALAPCAKAPVAAAVTMPQPRAATPPAAPAAENTFVMDVTLSPRAAAMLARRKESLLVWVQYYGDPIPSRANEADEQGIYLGEEKVVSPGRAGRIVVPIRNLNRDRLSWVAGRRVNVSVLVLSARRGSPDNLLDCNGAIFATLPEVVGRTHSSYCEALPGS